MYDNEDKVNKLLPSLLEEIRPDQFIKNVHEKSIMYTLLHALASNPKTDYELLLCPKEPINYNAQDTRGWTPLHTACYFGNKNTVRLLLERGADLNLSDSFWTKTINNVT